MTSVQYGSSVVAVTSLVPVSSAVALASVVAGDSVVVGAAVVVGASVVAGAAVVAAGAVVVASLAASSSSSPQAANVRAAAAPRAISILGFIVSSVCGSRWTASHSNTAGSTEQRCSLAHRGDAGTRRAACGDTRMIVPGRCAPHATDWLHRTPRRLENSSSFTRTGGNRQDAPFSSLH